MKLKKITMKILTIVVVDCVRSDCPLLDWVDFEFWGWIFMFLCMCVCHTVGKGEEECTKLCLENGFAEEIRLIVFSDGRSP